MNAKFSLWAAALLSLTALNAESAQVNWGSTRLAQNLTSAGPMGEGFTFELGAFQEGFTPTAVNVGEWNDKWVSVQASEYNAKLNFFAGSAVFNAAPEGASQQAFIWGYDVRQSGEGEQGEWILMSNPEWTWPRGSSIANPVDWVASNATLTVVGTVGGNGFHLRTEKVSLSSATNSPEAWHNLYFAGTDQAWDADPDKDGLANVVEYALGMNPTQTDASGLEPGFEKVDGKFYLAMSVEKNAGAAVRYIVEVSTDLTNWSQTVNTLEETETLLTVRDSEPVNGSRYMRLRIELDR